MSQPDRKASRRARPELMPLEGRQLLTVTGSPYALAFGHGGPPHAAALTSSEVTTPTGLIGGTRATTLAPTGKFATAATNLKAVAALDAQSAATGHLLAGSPATSVPVASSLAGHTINGLSVGSSAATKTNIYLGTKAPALVGQSKVASSPSLLVTQPGGFASTAAAAIASAHTNPGHPVNVAAEQAAVNPGTLNAANRLS